MHYRCAIVMPPTDDVEATVAEIMAPFHERLIREERSYPPFWDTYKIKGRSSDPEVPDIIRFDELTGLKKYYRCIIASKTNHPSFMLEREYWNGVNHVRTDWDGYIDKALEAFKYQYTATPEQFKQDLFPQPDWLVVTIDYHS